MMQSFSFTELMFGHKVCSCGQKDRERDQSLVAAVVNLVLFTLFFSATSSNVARADEAFNPRQLPVVYVKPSPTELVIYSPEGLNQFRGGSGIFGEVVRDFPATATAFYTALGAIAAYQLVFDYAQNPVAMDQLATALQDPVMHMGFFTFMLAARMTTHAITPLITNPRLRVAIPYLGMSVGFLASHIFTEVANLPGMRICVGQYFNLDRYRNGTLSLEPCQRAFQAFTSRNFEEKGHELFPRLAALVTSAFLSGITQSAIQQMIAKQGMQQALKMVGLQVGWTSVPGGIVIRSARWIAQVAQFKLFLSIYNWAEDQFFVQPYENFVHLGPRLKTAHQEVETALRSGRINGLAEKLINLSGVANKWRDFSMREVLASHQFWAQYLDNLLKQVALARIGYQSIVDSIERHRNVQAMNPNQEGLIAVRMPLWGIRLNPTPTGDANIDEALTEIFKGLEPVNINLFTQTRIFEERQLAVAQRIQAYLRKNRQTIEQSFVNLHQADRGIAREILKDLIEPNLDGPVDLESLSRFSNALRRLRRYSEADQYFKSATRVQAHFIPTFNPRQLAEALRPIFLLLGNPNPMLEKGQVFVARVNALMSVFGENPFPKRNAGFATPNPLDYLITQMFFGPTTPMAEYNSSRDGSVPLSRSSRQGSSSYRFISRNTHGFPATFTPPKLIDGEIVGSQRWRGRGGYAGHTGFDAFTPLSVRNSIFGAWVDLRSEIRTIPEGNYTMLEHLLLPRSLNIPQENQVARQGSTSRATYAEAPQPGPLEMSVATNPEGQPEVSRGFAWWWTNSVDLELAEALIEFGERYERIVYSLYKKLMSRDEHVLNRSDFSNGVLTAMHQEATIYFFTLGYLLGTREQRSQLMSQIRVNLAELGRRRFLQLPEGSPVIALRDAYTQLTMLIDNFQERPRETRTIEEGVEVPFLATRVSTDDIERTHGAFEALLEDFSRRIEGQSAEFKEPLAAALSGLRILGAQLRGYLQIINAVSFVEQTGRGINPFARRQCSYITLESFPGAQRLRGRLECDFSSNPRRQDIGEVRDGLSF